MKSDFIKKLLRPPRYLSMKAAGIDISDRFVRYIEFVEKKGRSFGRNFGEVPLPANTFKEGEILNKNALVKVLSDIKKKISSNFVKLSIPEEKTYIFDTESSACQRFQCEWNRSYSSLRKMFHSRWTRFFSNMTW